MREGDRHPIECLHLRRAYGVDRDGAFRCIPQREHGHETGEEQRGAAGIADAQRAVGEIRHGGSEGGRGHDRAPIEERVEFFRHDLGDYQRNQQAEEQRGPGQIAPVERHRHRVAAGFAEGRCGDLDDPEGERDFGDLAQRCLPVGLVHGVVLHMGSLCMDVLPGSHLAVASCLGRQ